jgi:hypothetical protein
MMGPKTLSTVKQELRAALAETGKDPIQWLEDRIRLLEKAESGTIRRSSFFRCCAACWTNQTR